MKIQPFSYNREHVTVISTQLHKTLDQMNESLTNPYTCDIDVHHLLLFFTLQPRFRVNTHHNYGNRSTTNDSKGVNQHTQTHTDTQPQSYKTYSSHHILVLVSMSEPTSTFEILLTLLVSYLTKWQ